jgi:hypothetical protein
MLEEVFFLVIKHIKAQMRKYSRHFEQQHEFELFLSKRRNTKETYWIFG